MVELSVTLVTGAQEERRVHDALLRIRERWNLEPYEKTHAVRIERGVIPHSHPVLTLSDRYGDDDEHLLATYLHEQLHWWSMECPGARDGRDEAVYERLAKDYPLPIEPPEGCGDELSNLIHLHVCWLEFEALCGLLGDERARTILRSLPYYRAVYRTVLDEAEMLREIFVAAAMDLPPDRRDRTASPEC